MILKVLSYPRSLIAALILFMWTFFWSVVTFIGYQFTRQREFGDFVLKHWSQLFLDLYSIELVVEGRENLPEKPCLFLFNHTSHFDIPILANLLSDRTLRFGAKAELFHIPFFGRAMDSMGNLKIHRSRREEVIELYKKSLANMDIGFNYILAPEGTRQSGEKLGRFKAGPFIMSLSGEKTLVPIVMKGAHLILPKSKLLPSWGRWKNQVYIQILKPIETHGWVIDQRLDLQSQVEQVMNNTYDSIRL